MQSFSRIVSTTNKPTPSLCIFMFTLNALLMLKWQQAGHLPGKNFVATAPRFCLSRSDVDCFSQVDHTRAVGRRRPCPGHKTEKKTTRAMEWHHRMDVTKAEWCSEMMTLVQVQWDRKCITTCDELLMIIMMWRCMWCCWWMQVMRRLRKKSLTESLISLQSTSSRSKSLSCGESLLFFFFLHP